MLRSVLSGVLALPAAALALLVAVPVALVGLPFWLVSRLTRLIAGALRAARPSAVAWPELIEPEPVVGWRPKAGLDCHAMSDRVFHLTTDDEGWRGRTRLDDAEVVVIGDSFAFGTGASDRGFFANQPVGVSMKAVGGNGYSMVHELLWLRRLQDRLANKLVAWMVYYGNDLVDNLRPNLDRYRTPFVRERRDGRGWEVISHHVGPEPWPMPDQRRYHHHLAELCCPRHEASRAYAAAAFLLREGSGVCRSAGARLVVVGIPDARQLDPAESGSLRSLASRPEAFDPALPDRELQAACASLGVRFVPLSRHLTRAHYKLHDCHWNRRGHRRVAEVLAELHREASASPPAVAWRPIATPVASAGRVGTR